MSYSAKPHEWIEYMDGIILCRMCGMRRRPNVRYGCKGLGG